ncbi:DNA mismatch repair endonuclease MutL [Larkinella punicea]|uniref:DNA mismatch repair protein MutL n=1 Tax=Larkinella punicea TaxID=2315727 RepID=A0A368JN61_9BACT|nr:DNA mismatch repair endonuclease MutL [Larkinella punicea]RCR68094.1 DNA mismatch repair endonuclease MutL [Larkinella punicea]
MLNIIQLLPDSIANQIAAGEVVQRPASVVKELLENSVDAQAKTVQIIIRDAGKTLIQIIDDGIGMSETDARMSFERHATSKIRSSDDLFRIRTMGFRGEALASIAAIAQVELRTRRSDASRTNDELGTLIRMEGSELKTQETVSCLPGTNILVKNLFFNVPARRNFLKTNSVEMRHILDEFQRVALAHPEVAFSLYHNDSEVYNLQAGKLSRRIVDLFGKQYREQLAFCEEETPYVNVRGYIGKPEFARKTRGEQFFFVNSRFVKHNYLHHAVVGAYEGTIQDGFHPFYVLFIEIDPSHIDINIHPTKTEIKFDDERSVYAIVMAAVRKAVGVYNLTPSLDFDSNVNFLPVTPAPRRTSEVQVGNGSGQSDAQSRSPLRPMSPAWSTEPAEHKAATSFDFPRKSAANWQALFEGLETNETPATEAQNLFENNASADSQAEIESVTLGSRVNKLITSAVALEGAGPILQVHNRYLVTSVQAGMLVIDQRRAYERVLYDQYQAALTKRNGVSQQLLFPKTVTVMPVDYNLALELRDDLTSLGFLFDEIGQNAFMIRGVPALSVGENEEELFANLLAQLREDTGRLKLERAEVLARSLARRSAARHQKQLAEPEQRALVDQLIASSNPSYTPGGEPITTVLALDKLAGLFRS